MCSIFGIMQTRSAASDLRNLAIRQSAKMRHRGPDWSGVWADDKAIFVHERLAIVDIDSGEQPLLSGQTGSVLVVNGEIYNHRSLRQSFDDHYPFATGSDCEVILPLLDEAQSDAEIKAALNRLRGMFAFIHYQPDSGRIIIARDPIGVIPLYIGRDEQGQLWVASEMKALSGHCVEIEVAPPGHFWHSDSASWQPYYQRDWFDYAAVKDNEADPASIRQSLSGAVRSHLMSDVPYGVLLSGGLDSSIVSALAAQYATRRVEDDGKSMAWWPRLHSFAVGLKGSPDLQAAQQVADAIGTVHHSVEFTIEQGIDALSEVIYHLETYDVTTIRAATPMYLMARKIKSMGIKMVLSGEGADEIFGGYLYFHKAPDAKALHEETVRKLKRLHHFDCLRANKAMAAWGVEARVPFLDRDFIDVAMRINPQAKMCTDGRMEKHILREAFAGLLPESILWRQKEQFSDGVGYGWIDALRDHAERVISDSELARAAVDYPINTPDSKEALLYRKLFQQHFAGNAEAATVMGGKSIACSTPEALAWDASFSGRADPSGRAVSDIHKASPRGRQQVA